jgi:hypothetical protein
MHPCDPAPREIERTTTAEIKAQVENDGFSMSKEGRRKRVVVKNLSAPPVLYPIFMEGALTHGALLIQFPLSIVPPAPWEEASARVTRSRSDP